MCVCVYVCVSPCACTHQYHYRVLQVKNIIGRVLRSQKTCGVLLIFRTCVAFLIGTGWY